MKKILLAIIVLGFMGNTSCKKKTCPAYQENQKEEYNLKTSKRKKAKLF